MFTSNDPVIQALALNICVGLRVEELFTVEYKIVEKDLFFEKLPYMAFKGLAQKGQQ
jgi:hypothetical protein